MVICLDKDTLSCVTCRRNIERALWVIWIELDISGELCDVGLSCIIYTRKSGLPVRDRIFEDFQKSKYRPRFWICFLRITHQRVSLEKLWAIRKKRKLYGDSRWLQKVALDKLLRWKRLYYQCSRPHLYICLTMLGECTFWTWEWEG